MELIEVGTPADHSNYCHLVQISCTGNCSCPSLSTHVSFVHLQNILHMAISDPGRMRSQADVLFTTAR